MKSFITFVDAVAVVIGAYEDADDGLITLRQQVGHLRDVDAAHTELEAIRQDTKALLERLTHFIYTNMKAPADD